MADVITDLTDEDIRTELLETGPRADADQDATDTGDGVDGDGDSGDSDDDASDGDADGTDS